MELSDFDKCKICINCKITHNKQDNTLYIIKNISLILGSSLLFKIYNQRVCAPLPTELRSRLNFNVI